MPQTIANASTDGLRASGLSAAKARTLQNAASLIADGALSDAEIEDQFDLGYHFKHVDTIFRRVFGEA